MPDPVVLVALGVDGAQHDDELRTIADATGASVAYLHLGAPSLTDELDRLSAAGARRIEVVGLAFGTAVARSWLRRVAGHWHREHPEVEVAVSGRAVNGQESPLRSPAWERVPSHRQQVLVCRGPRCSAQGSAATAAALADALRDRGLEDDDVLLTQTGCLFPCNHAPVVVVHPDDAWLGPVDAEAAASVVADMLAAGPRYQVRRLPRASR